VHPMYYASLWFTRGVDSFKGILLETMVDLNLGQPKKGSKNILIPTNGFIASWNRMRLSE
jgi:hypothetical protein